MSSAQRVGRLGKGRAGQDRTGLDAEMETDGVEESSAAVSRAWRRLLFARAHGVRRSGQGGLVRSCMGIRREIQQVHRW